ncbi:MAG: DUF86 domain-containing protein [Elusimicrobia bacterium]|nr:DUF86 domain-containing protein [Candidatus Liberimonas magnetica]
MRNNKLYLEDIREAAARIMEYTRPLTSDGFVSDTKTFDAVIRNLEIIGEAAKNIPEAFKSKYPDVEWKAIVGMRNILTHEYFGLDYEEIWKTIKKEIPDLKKAVEKILGELTNE